MASSAAVAGTRSGLQSLAQIEAKSTSPYGLPIVDNCSECKLRGTDFFCCLSGPALAALDEIKHTTSYPEGALVFMVLSYTLTVAGLFILRRQRPDIERPVRCVGYPWVPAIYVIAGAAWTLNTIITRPKEAIAGAAIVLIGVPGYLYWKRASRNANAAE